MAFSGWKLQRCVLVVVSVVLVGCGSERRGSPELASPGPADSGASARKLVPGLQTLQPGARYSAARFDPPFTFKVDAEWQAVAHDGRDGRNAGEITLSRGGAILHFEQPGISDASGGAPVDAPSTIDAFVAALKTVPGIDVVAVEAIEAGGADARRVDVTLAGPPGRWPRAIFGVDELCIAPGAVTRFYLFELTGRVFLGLPPCEPTVGNDDFSQLVEPLLETIEGLADS